MTDPNSYQPGWPGYPAESSGHPTAGQGYPQAAPVHPATGPVPYSTAGYPPADGMPSPYPAYLPTGVGYPATGPAYPITNGAPVYPPPGFVPGGTYLLAQPRNGMGVAALVCGIVGVVLCWNYGGIVLNILAIIFGAVGLGRATRGEASNRGAAMAGLVLGIIGLAIFIILVVAVASLFF